MKEFPPFRLDFVNQCLWRRGNGADEERILLAPKALAMLRYLVERAGRRWYSRKYSKLFSNTRSGTWAGARKIEETHPRLRDPDEF